MPVLAYLGLREQEDEDGGQHRGHPEDVEGGGRGHLTQLPPWGRVKGVVWFGMAKV